MSTGKRYWLDAEGNIMSGVPTPFGKLNAAQQQLANIAQQYAQQYGSQLLGGSFGNWSPNSQIHGSPVNAANPGDPRAQAGITWQGNLAIAPWQGLAFGPGPAIEDAGVKAGEVIGWRWWDLGRDKRRRMYLESLMTTMPWPPSGIECPISNLEHPMSLGIHAYKDHDRADYQSAYLHSSRVFGSVLLWGQIYEHEHGYRAQYAKVRSIEYAPPGPWYDSGKPLRALRKIYGCPSA